MLVKLHKGWIDASLVRRVLIEEETYSPGPGRPLEYGWTVRLKLVDGSLIDCKSYDKEDAAELAADNLATTINRSITES